MAIDVKPGTQVCVKVSAEPTNQAAAKTLSRVFARGRGGRKLRSSRKQLRTNHIEGRQRGGRTWMVRPKAPRLCQPKKGDDCIVFATSALINDLRSLVRFVEVTPAKSS